MSNWPHTRTIHQTEEKTARISIKILGMSTAYPEFFKQLVNYLARLFLELSNDDQYQSQLECTFLLGFSAYPHQRT